MKLKGKEYGTEPRVFKIFDRVITSATAEQRVSFENIPKESRGKRLALVGLVLELPLAAFTGAGSKSGDGVSISQLLGDVSIAYAAGSPEAAALGHQMMVDRVDGPALLQLLSARSGVGVIAGLGHSVSWSQTVAAADVTGPGKIGCAQTLARTIANGNWLQFVGPTFAADATTTLAFSERVRIYLPLGLRARHGFEHAIPVPDLAGQGYGTCTSGGAAGWLSFVLGQTVDGQAVTWTTSGDNARLEVHAVCVEVEDKLAMPPAWCIDKFETQEKTITLNPGAHEFIGFVKALNAGAQPAHDYTLVSLRVDGDELLPTEAGDHMAVMCAIHNTAEHGFGFSETDTALPAITQTARRANFCYPLYFSYAGSLLQMVGSDREGAVKVQIVTTSEASHRLLASRYAPITDGQRRAAEEQGAGGATCKCSDGKDVPTLQAVVNARNGNAISLASPLAKILPHVLVDRAKAANFMPG